MNKVLLTILLSALAFSLAAQMGLFELSFDDSREATFENLLGKGFVIDTDDGFEVTMAAPDSFLVESIELQFSPENTTLVSWLLAYAPQDDVDLEELVLDALFSWHGDYLGFDDYFEEYYWELGGDHSVYAYYDWGSDIFYVEYVGPGKY